MKTYLGRKRLKLNTSNKTDRVNKISENMVSEIFYKQYKYILTENTSKNDDKESLNSKFSNICKMKYSEPDLLKYSIISYSSFNKEFKPENIINEEVYSKKNLKLHQVENYLKNHDLNTQDTQLLKQCNNKKWVISASLCKEYILLKLEKVAILKNIVFKKFINPTLMKEFKIYIGLEKENLIHVVTSGISEDNSFNYESFDLNIKGDYIPCQ
jgi:hypothetical protein